MSFPSRLATNEIPVYVDGWVAPKGSLCLERRGPKVADGDGEGIFRAGGSSARSKNASSKNALVKICGKTVTEVRFFCDTPEVGAVGYPSIFISTCPLLLSVCAIMQL